LDHIKTIGGSRAGNPYYNIRYNVHNGDYRDMFTFCIQNIDIHTVTLCADVLQMSCNISIECNTGVTVATCIVLYVLNEIALNMLNNNNNNNNGNIIKLLCFY